MLTVTREQYESYLYIKLSLKKAGIYRALYNRAAIFFTDQEFNENTCTEFLQSLGDISPAAYNNYLKALKKLAECQGYTFLKDYKLRKTEQPYIPILEEGEMIRILNEAYKADYRRAVALELFLRTGMRSEELIELEWREYHVSTLFIDKTKTSKSRTIEILPDMADKLERLRGNHPRYIFSTYKGNLNRSKFNLFLARLLQKIGLNKHVTCHKLRHSYATLCASKGISHFVIQALLGHTNIQTTQTYIHTTTAMKKEAAKKVSLGEYKLTHTETVDELLRYVNSLHTDESEIIINKVDGKLTVEVVKKK